MFSKRNPGAEAPNMFKYKKCCIKAVWKLCGFSKYKPHAEVRNFKISEMLHKRCVDTAWVFKMQTAHRGTNLKIADVLHKNLLVFSTFKLHTEAPTRQNLEKLH